ncbi:hypothetical protein HBI56_054460 [Parastagonospora nodorum]|uniref:Uncharacterized protein n=1 Tax=Phaeosphaeria nodorum (strain SN15 / ATCC MYA-4574 / FGSC 10173) TaxID=321614 RepID=A0A7U2NR15_PHANO|nr:hypothetical protein HBH56_097660 [Parastagonospora nodorum]QRD07335.1 hypothetical protein JI435_125220 [Parastagonospora nodorum SN15]KAH3930291.1 hypothetical protein HBH54_111990 [Parastagonospora nodorum]KAH3945100.1 hypothetical protein HBH53_147450 [Parastagonospora nodorum]KAH3967088.1 hypothetical protein HBH51_138850 [Parastagonospora nodorum]
MTTSTERARNTFGTLLRLKSAGCEVPRAASLAGPSGEVALLEHEAAGRCSGSRPQAADCGLNETWARLQTRSLIKTHRARRTPGEVICCELWCRDSTLRPKTACSSQTLSGVAACVGGMARSCLRRHRHDCTMLGVAFLPPLSIAQFALRLTATRTCALPHTDGPHIPCGLHITMWLLLRKQCAS